MTDKLFKLAAVTLAAGFLWVYYINGQNINGQNINGQNGRYQMASTHPTALVVLDTREGIVFRPMFGDMLSPTK